MNLEQLTKEYPIGTRVHHNGWSGKLFTIVGYNTDEASPYSRYGLKATCSGMSGIVRFHQLERVTIVMRPDPYKDEDWV